MTQLTKREQIAAMAMQGLCANQQWMNLFEGEKYSRQVSIISTACTDLADSLLKHLEETEPDLKPKEEDKSDLLTKDQRAECEKVMNLDCVRETIELLKGILSKNS
jgi:hypothetical protein